MGSWVNVVHYYTLLPNHTIHDGMIASALIILILKPKYSSLPLLKDTPFAKQFCLY